MLIPLAGAATVKVRWIDAQSLQASVGSVANDLWLRFSIADEGAGVGAGIAVVATPGERWRAPLPPNCYQ